MNSLKKTMFELKRDNDFERTNLFTARAQPNPLKEIEARTELSSMHRTYQNLGGVYADAEFHLNCAYTHAVAAVNIANRFAGNKTYENAYFNAYIALMHASHALRLTEQAQNVALHIKTHPDASDDHKKAAESVLAPSRERSPTL